MTPPCQNYCLAGVRPVGDGLVVRVIGRLLHCGSWIGQETIDELTKLAGRGRLYIDFGLIPSMTSSSLRPIIVLQRSVTASGGCVVLCGLRPSLEEIFRILGLERHFELRGEGAPGGCGPLPEPSWLAWNDGAVSKLARAIYADSAFDRLPILADALEDAGCADPDILAHCREPRVHVKVCWVADLILSKS
jgi:anti-anti-sigma factor